MPVETALVVQQAVTDRFEGVGTIDAGEEITVVSEIDGTVTSLPFREGGHLDKGALIAQLDDVQLRAEVERSEALRDQSRSTYDRVKTVVDQAAGTAQDLDDAAAALKVAEANLALAHSRLDKTRITAPFSGIAGARRISPGAFVRAGQAITDLANIQDIRVVFSMPERFLSKINRGASVTISTTAYPGYELDGTIDIIEPVLDEATRSARVIAVAKNPDEKFRPGMSANVRVVLSERSEAVTVPSEAVFVEGSQAFVFVVKGDSTVTRTPLSLGTRMADVVEVVSGLQSGNRVVRAGHQKLFEGAKVMPVSSQPQGEAPPADMPEPDAEESQ
jgi:membrane fusion protein (multidrug efflux system)